MSALAELLSSRTRAEIFRLLFGVSGGALHTREIQLRARSSVGGVQLELQKLRRLVRLRKDACEALDDERLREKPPKKVAC